MAKDNIKHDVEANWKKAKTFIPRLNEIVIYDPDDTTKYYRVKVGNGVDVVNDLPFATPLQPKWRAF